jgi:hypothetical protein
MKEVFKDLGITLKGEKSEFHLMKVSKKLQQ